MSFELGDEIRIRHMLDAIEEIQKATKGYTEETFIGDHVLRIAVVKWIEIIGEASVNISAALKEEYKETDWRIIKGMRNIVVHEYFGIKYDLIWQVATVNLPELSEQLKRIIEEKF